MNDLTKQLDRSRSSSASVRPNAAEAMMHKMAITHALVALAERLSPDDPVS